MKTNRRVFFRTAGAGAAGLGLAPMLTIPACTASGEADTHVNDAQQLFAGDDVAIATTQY